MKIQNLRNQYPKGTRIEVIHMEDPNAVKKGSIGTVQFVDDMGTIHVHWDDGGSLGLIPGVDSFKVVQENELNYEVKDVDINLNASLIRKDYLEPEPHHISKAVKVSQKEFRNLINKPLRDRDYIEKLSSQMYQDEFRHHSILVYCDEEPDAMLIQSEGYNYARYSSFIPNIHELLETHTLQQDTANKYEKIKVLVVEPNNKPFVAIIDNDLKASQAMVGGYIEAIPLSDTAEIIANEEGKILDLPANRRLGNDVIAGRFIIVGVDEGEHFKSLSQQDINKYTDQFQEIEMIDQSEVQKNMKFDIIF